MSLLRSRNCTSVPKEGRHHCNNCNTTFSVTVGTIFQKTKVDLQKWFLAITLVSDGEKTLSARALAREVRVNKNTAWHMGAKIRNAMAEDPDFLRGIVAGIEEGSPSVEERIESRRAGRNGEEEERILTQRSSSSRAPLRPVKKPQSRRLCRTAETQRGRGRPCRNSAVGRMGRVKVEIESDRERSRQPGK